MGTGPRSIINLERCASIVSFPSEHFGPPANDEFVDLLDIGARLFLWKNWEKKAVRLLPIGASPETRDTLIGVVLRSPCSRFVPLRSMM